MKTKVFITVLVLVISAWLGFYTGQHLAYRDVEQLANDVHYYMKTASDELQDMQEHLDTIGIQTMNLRDEQMGWRDSMVEDMEYLFGKGWNKR